MRTLVLLALVLCPALVTAKVLNVEFKFTPYTGDTKDDKVTTVPGTARIFLNNVPIGEQEVRKDEVPVIFDEREIASAVWVPVESLGPAVRKGKNTFRVEFLPTNAKATYKAQLRWASVTDEVREEESPGEYKGTNQADQGVENETATGKVVMQRDFTGDFAQDQPWHHYPTVTTLTDDDKRTLGKLVQERVGWFAPDFAAFYESLAENPRMEPEQVAELKKRKCLDAAHKAGVKIRAAAPADLDFTTTGGPEVVVRGKKATLYPPDREGFGRIKGGDEVQMCAAMALSLVYPNKLVAVRGDDGVWKVAY
jgi:hypothetical protein